jgi:hypothetical protein
MTPPPATEKEKYELAKATAIAYYGLSGPLDSFPKGTVVEFYEPKGDVSAGPTFDSVKAEMARDIAKMWRDNIGMQSRTSRVSNYDVCAYVNTILKKMERSTVNPDSELVSAIMEDIACTNASVVLVRIKHLRDHKLLLVNTSITM